MSDETKIALVVTTVLLIIIYGGPWLVASAAFDADKAACYFYPNGEMCQKSGIQP